MLRVVALLVAAVLAVPLHAQAGEFLAGAPPLYYETLGAGGPLVVVVHGGPGVPHDYLRPEWDQLARGARVVYYDQRGCGRSGRVPPYGWRAHVQDLDRLLTALAPTEPVVLAGSSWGAALAVYYTTRHPARVRALVLSGVPGGILNAAGVPLDPGYLATLPVARWDSVDHGLPVGPTSPRPALDPRITARVHEDCGDVHGVVFLSLRDAPRLTALRAVTQPTLILRGGDPRNILRGDAGALLARQLPHAQLVTVPDAGHDPWLDQPATFFARGARVPRAVGAGPARPAALSAGARTPNAIEE